MFGTKLIVIAAIVAVSLGATEAKKHVRVHHLRDGAKPYSVELSAAKHQKAKAYKKKSHWATKKKSHTKHHPQCEGGSPMSVEGVGTFCVWGDACSGKNFEGSCPYPQEGLAWGAACGKVKTGVAGCQPLDESDWEDHANDWDWDSEHDHDWDSTYGWGYEGEDDDHETQEVDDDDVEVECEGDDASPMSVEGVGTFCVMGDACVDDNFEGACPGPQPGLEWGSTCGEVKTGVAGCQPNTADESTDYEDEIVVEVPTGDCSGPDESPMSVEGAGTYCITGPACVDDNFEGVCPGPQEGLEYGAYCDVVETGVAGCIPYTQEEMH